MQIGAYKLGERIASGRLAQVYRGFDNAGAPVAIKLLSPEAELDDPAARDRFLREIEMLSRVSHPNVISLLGHGIDDELGPYLVTPLVMGTTLREHMARGPVLPEIALLGLREVASGIAAMHAAGVVHRDLKPENIMIQADGHIVVIDLGLAYRQNQTRYTEEGAVAGSVPYMAPEQVEADHISPATDVWALGVIFYEWIAGQRPFARSRATEEVAAILSGRYPPLSERNSCATADHDALIARCLAPLAHRAANAQQLIGLIEGCMDWPNAREHGRSAFKNPAGYADKLSRYRADALATDAHKLISRGEVFSATRLIDRGLAYRPSDPSLLSLLDAATGSPKPGWRRALPALAIIGAVLTAIAIAVVLYTSSADEGLSLPGGAASGEPTDGEPAAALVGPTNAAGLLELDASTLPNEFRRSKAAVAAYKAARYEHLLPRKLFGGNPYSYTMRPGDVGSDFESQLNLAKAFLVTYKKEKGLELLVSLAKQFPKQPKLWLFRAYIAGRRGNLKRADEFYTKALALAPTSVDALSRRGVLRLRTNRVRDAHADLIKAATLDPEHLGTVRGVAELYRVAGKAAAAAPLLKRALKRHPDDPELLIDTALASADKTARELMARALQRAPGHKRAIRENCLLLNRQKHPDALRACEHAASTLYRDIEVSLAAGYAYLRANHIMKARVRFTMAAMEDKTDPRGPLGLVAVHKQTHSPFTYMRRSLVQACDRGAKQACEELNQHLKKAGKPAHVPTPPEGIPAVPASPTREGLVPAKPVGK